MKLSRYVIRRLVVVFYSALLVWSVLLFNVLLWSVHSSIDDNLEAIAREVVIQANHKRGFIESLEQNNLPHVSVIQTEYRLVKDLEERFYTDEIFYSLSNQHTKVRRFETVFRCELNGRYYVLNVFTANIDNIDLVWSVFWMLLLLYVVLGVLLVMVSQRLVHRAMHPFYLVVERLKGFRLGKTKDVRIEYPTEIDELSVLMSSVNELLDKNSNVYKEQKNFIENATHELQTPIAAMIAKIEHMLSSGNLTEVQGQALGGMLRTLHNMKRLNSGLLLLSKVENNQYPELSEVDIQEVFIQCYENFQELIDYRGLRFEVVQSEVLVWEMNKDLAMIMVNNLIKNAVMHNVQGGGIYVYIGADGFRIENDGERNTSPEEDIFERYKCKGNNGTLGLGLAIIKTIVNFYGKEVRYYYKGRHIIEIQ